MSRQIKTIARYLAIIVGIIIVLNILFSLIGKIPSEKEDSRDVEKEAIFLKLENSTLISMKLPAVDTDGKGTTTAMTVEAVKGSGRTLVDIENLLFWADTQQSIRMARFVAGNISGINLNDYDLIYNIKANATLIGGPSAGAALTLATIFAIKGEKPRADVMITGTINHDGTIGPVAGILEKANASRNAGAIIFLVPLLESKDVIYDTETHCQTFGESEVCSSETKPRRVDVEKESGIKVVEIENIRDALGYFNTNSEIRD